MADLSHFSYSYLSQAGSTRFPLKLRNSFPIAANISSPGREGARGGERVMFLQNTKEFNIRDTGCFEQTKIQKTLTVNYWSIIYHVFGYFLFGQLTDKLGQIKRLWLDSWWLLHRLERPMYPQMHYLQDILPRFKIAQNQRNINIVYLFQRFGIYVWFVVFNIHCTNKGSHKKKRIFYGQADRKRLPPLLRSAFCELFLACFLT